MKLNYRPEIDGLRAIAVFAVVFYHANFTVNGHEIFQGGFLGVDIFFVISGYLITSLIYKSLLNKNFSLKDFYIRRIRRILPILFFVILTCIPFAYFFYLPSSLDDFLKSTWSVLTFSSNFYFFHTGLIYGGPDASLKPLLHTWSLSVEEQFYILFPFLLMVIYKFIKDKVLFIFSIIFLASLFSTLLISKYLPENNFYFLNVRLWELLSGSIISILEIRNPKLNSKKYNRYLPLLGLFLITGSFFLLNDSMSLPSFYTIPSILGTCLIIFFQNKKDILSNFLSLKLFVFLGLISYSIYLWHYPLFSFYDYIFFSIDSNFPKLLIIFLSIIISILTYKFIEKPFRNKLIISNKQLFKYVMSILILIIILTISIFQKGKGYQENIYEKVNLDNLFYISEVQNVFSKLEYQYSRFSAFTEKKKNILVVGNSHAEDLYLMLKTNLNFTKNSNFHLVRINFIEENLNKINLNKNNISEYFEKSDVIIFSNRWSKNDLKILENILPDLMKTKKKIILTNQNINLPSTGKRDVTLLDKFIIDKKRLPTTEEIFALKKEYFDYVLNDKKRNKYNNTLKNISEKYNLPLLDKSLYQCDNQSRTCEIFTPLNEKINYNNNHHTLAGIRYLGKIIYDSGWLKLH